MAPRGRGAGGLARGDETHSSLGKNRRIEAWELHPLHGDERRVARRLVGVLRSGYVLADAFLDGSQLHARCAQRGLQRIAPRRRPGTGRGHQRQEPARLRAVDLLECALTGFGPTLYPQRGDIERYLRTLRGAYHGVGTLPAWVRGPRRARQWVAAKLILFDNATKCRRKQPRWCNILASSGARSPRTGVRTLMDAARDLAGSVAPGGVVPSPPPR